MSLGKKADDAPFKLGVLLLNIRDVTIEKNKINIHCDDMTFPVHIKNAIAKSKDGSKQRFVNEFGKFYYAESREKLPEFFLTEETRPSFEGENMLVDLIINANDMAGEAEFTINPKKIFREKDPSELKRLLEDTQVVAWGTHYQGEQSVFYEFLPSETYPQFEKDNPQTDKVKNWLKKLRP